MFHPFVIRWHVMAQAASGLGSWLHSFFDSIFDAWYKEVLKFNSTTSCTQDLAFHILFLGPYTEKWS